MAISLDSTNFFRLLPSRKRDGHVSNPSGFFVQAMFRYDGKYQKVYILAITSRGEEIELEVNKDGEVINL